MSRIRSFLAVVPFVIASGMAPYEAHGAAGAPSGDTYPTRPVRLIVPFGTGGTDIIARVVAKLLSARLGNQVITENRPGAGGTIGMDLVAKAEPDGYTLLFTSPSIAISPSFYKLSFDPVRAFTPVVKASTGPIVFTVHPSLPVRSVKELVALAQRKPGALIASGSGVGSFTHLATELFKQVANIDYLIVQYKGGSAGLLAILVGDSQLGFNAVTSSLPHVQSGKLRALAFGGNVKSKLLPGVPTIAEAGISGYEANTWNGLLAPAGTPKAIVDRIYKETAALLRLDATRATIEDQGAAVDPLGPDEFGRFIAAEAVKWSNVARNIKAK